LFAIIDIETCGGKFTYGNGRIIEIAIVIHDGLVVTNTYSTLINPECYISNMYTNISGITNEMVADAPKFYEVAKHISEFTEGCVFVAHNVKFDYNFVRDEFNSLGFKYKRETLCTVQLSRKLIPGKLSYSLGKLCASLGIEIQNRHRALGDAEATAKLFDLLLQAKSLHPQYKNKGVAEIMAKKIDGIKKYVLQKLPESCGVYYFLNNDKQIIYIGKSINMYSRAISHFNTDLPKSKKMLHELMDVDFVETGSELLALLHESQDIKEHKPLFNRRSKADIFTHSIIYFKNNSGIINFKISEFSEEKNVLASFTKYSSAHQKMETWIDEHAMCMRYCGLTSDDSICFNHQIKKCNGICAGIENIEIYNKRAAKILNEYIFSTPNFVLIDKGRKANEKSFVIIENSRFCGYGHFDAESTYTGIDELKEMTLTKQYYPDADELIRSWLKKNGTKIKVIKF